MQSIREALVSHGVVIVTDTVDPDAIKSARKSLIDSQWSIPHSATVGESPSDVMDNFVKFNVGGVFNTQIYRPRVLKAFYSPLWADDVFGIHDVGRRYVLARNQILGLEPGYATDQIENDGIWSALRVQHYPRGGGFLVPHQDTVISTAQKWSGIKNFIQLLLPLTEKGIDYKKGGGFVDVAGTRVLVDDQCDLGDMVMYSGLQVHGVQEIDADMPFDMDVRFGRQVMMCSFFRDLKRDESNYRGLHAN